MIYYTVLNVKETASASEIKTAYRDLIRQVHPDTIENLAPYLRKIAEDKAKEITEAHSVLSNSSKRRNYDRQLAEYRRQTMPQAPPAPQSAPSQTASSASFGYCNKCGTSLYASGYCPQCSKFAAPPGTRAASPPRPKAVRWLGYNWARLLRCASEHPILALAPPAVLVLVVAAALSSNDTSHADLNCPSSQRVEVNGRFVCQQVPVPPS
jgi:curved DNA-binding protein CbpA